jgi:squalene-hopene/tetraprenyl-beta-curcumene cyclase
MQQRIFWKSKALSASILLAISLILVPHSVVGAARSDAAMAKAQRAVARGLAYLRNTQQQDGSWNEYPATTALAVSAFLRNGKTERKEPAVAKGIRYLLLSVKPDSGIYSNANPTTALPNYNTALAIMALSLTRNPAYKTIIKGAQTYLEQLQFTEREHIDRSDPAYGGIGYGRYPDRPDLSNLSVVLQSLKESGLPSNAPVFQKALVFVQRVQNCAQSNDQAWVKEGPQDGGFVYDSTGRSQINHQGMHASIGSMTYSGLESYLCCGVPKQDPRVQAAWNWIRSHYTVSQHPGMGDTALYYYYRAMAETLAIYSQKFIRDASGHSHDWAHDLAAQITAKQRSDGSWVNANSRYWENQPALVTSYSLICLSYCLKR